MLFAKRYYAPAYIVQQYWPICLYEQWLYKCIVHFTWYWYTCIFNLKENRAISLQARFELVSFIILQKLQSFQVNLTHIQLHFCWSCVNNLFPSVLRHFFNGKRLSSFVCQSMNKFLRDTKTYIDSKKTDIQTIHLRDEKHSVVAPNKYHRPVRYRLVITLYQDRHG